jgi:hypothetical protein
VNEARLREGPFFKVALITIETQFEALKGMLYNGVPPPSIIN